MVHLALVAGGLLGIIVMALAFRREQTWPTLLLWVVPAALTASAADGTLHLLAGLWPTFAMDGGSGDTLRFIIACGVLLPPIEIFYQGLTTALAGRGVQYSEAVRDQ